MTTNDTSVELEVDIRSGCAAIYPKSEADRTPGLHMTGSRDIYVWYTGEDTPGQSVSEKQKLRLQRLAACWNAMRDVKDPEEFMRSLNDKTPKLTDQKLACGTPMGDMWDKPIWSISAHPKEEQWEIGAFVGGHMFQRLRGDHPIDIAEFASSRPEALRVHAERLIKEGKELLERSRSIKAAEEGTQEGTKG